MSLTDSQIAELCTRMNIPLAPVRGIAFKDEITAKDLQYNKAYFVNLSDEYGEDGQRNPGTHWTCFQIVKYRNGNVCPIYFDSFGVGPPENIKEAVAKFSKKKLPYTTKDIQSLMANACGFFCCAFLHYINNYYNRTGDVYEDTEQFLGYFEDLNKSADFLKNEYILKLFFQPPNSNNKITTAADIDFDSITYDTSGPVVNAFK